ncbi:class I SAM-dependent methyltransferase [Glycomyces artemisiae]|uniref:Putative O-methyltransferase YrrM n=1 Tax=Glycomyces artemisiae TaxID=1076443 RepID=A0A2T0UMB8_9ACTN|nr:class I SAM-dependent methyltransferase [Glycomyces artemisiae]PRY59060.1 putative O-methyltransferase YrrM [Glycomyces artemisiae]
MSFRIRAALTGAVALAAAGGAGYLLGGPALAGYALFSTALCGAAALLWRQSRRAQAEQRRQQAAVRQLTEKVSGLSRRVKRLQEDQEQGRRHLADRIDATYARIRQVPGDTRRLVREDDRSGRVLDAIGAVREEVESIPRMTRRLVREWNRIVYAEVEDLTALYRDIEPDRALPQMHGWSAGADLARYLYCEVAEAGRSSVLECGSGTTTVILAYAFRARGHGRVVSLEHDPRFAAATRRMIEERGLGEWAEVVDAPLADAVVGDAVWPWYDLDAVPEGPFDLLLVDGPPASVGSEARYPAVPLLLDRLAKDALVVLDDTRRPDERAIGERWAAELEGFALESLGHDHGTLVLRRGGEAAL